MHHIPSVHASFVAWAAVLGVLALAIMAFFLGGLVRRHLARLTVCLVIGVAIAFGATAWADGQRHTALAAAAHGHHAPSVTFTLAATFTVVTIVTAAVALGVSAIAGVVARRRSYTRFGPRDRSW